MKYRSLLFSVLFILYLAFSLFSMENVSISLRTGNFYDGVMKDSFLFIASGRGIDIYDITNPDSAVHLDSPGICNDIFLMDNLLYIADGPSGVAVYDISNPINPSLCDTFCSNNTFNEIFVRDSIFAASTKNPNGISIFKYGVSGNILRLSRIPLYFEVKGLYMKDSLLVAGLSSSQGIISYDISEPSNPTFKDSYTNLRVEDIAGKDTFLFVASRNIDVRIFNINDLSSGPIGAYPNNSWIFHLSICDSFLFLTGLFDSIYVLDISNPSSPSLIDSAKTLLPVTHPVSNGTILYSAETSTGELFEMSGYTQLTVLDSLYPITDGFICSTFAYVASKGKDLIILDISNPYSPSIISTFDSLKNIEAVYVRDKIAYLSCGEDGLYILDVAEPQTPSIISTLNTLGTLCFTLKRINTLFFAEGGSRFKTVSIENITQPESLDSLTNLPGYTYDIAVTDTIAFVSLGDGGFGVINIKDPNNLSLIGTFAGDTFSMALATNGEYLFVGTRDNGVKIYDVTDPSNPVYETTYDVSVPVNDVHYENNLLFLACDVSGIKVLNVENPASPFLKDSINTPGIASKIGPSWLGLIPVADYYSFRIDSSYRDTIPPSPVFNLTFEAQDSLIILRWTNPGDMDYEGTRLLFRNDRFPANPNDDTLLLDHKMEPNSPDSCYHKGLPGDSTHFYYAVYAYDNSNNFSSPALISGISASDTTPPDPVSIDIFIFWSDTIEVFFYTGDSLDYAGVRAMYSTTHIPNNIHDGELFFDTTFTYNSYDSMKLGGVAINKTYYFTFFGKDEVPNFSEGVSDSCRIPPDTIPPGEVSIDTFIFWSDTIEVFFTTPNDPDFVGVRTMYDLTQPPQNPYEGELFFDDSLPPGTQISRTLGGVILDTTYYFTFFTRDTVPNFSEGVSDSYTTYTDTIPPGIITEFTAISIPSDSSDTIKVSWINPLNSDLDSIEIRWSKYNYPISPDSGAHKWNIPNPTPGDTIEKKWVSNSFVPGVRYYFSGFSFDMTGNVSAGAHTYCPTPKLTTVSNSNPHEPIEGETASWLDSVEISFTAPMLVPTLETGVEIKGREDYTFRIERGNGNRYIFIPPAFSALDTVIVTLKETIKDSIGNPFDGDGNGLPDTIPEYTWHFYTGLIGDYTGNDTITSEDFAIFKIAYESQDITKETGPCEGTIPYYRLIPDSTIDFEDFSIFVMMWNWSLDNRGFSEIGGGGSNSLLHIESINNNLIIKTDRCQGLIGGEILLDGTGDSVIVKKGKGLHENDIFLTRFIDKKVLISFGIMSKEIKNKAIANISLPLSMKEIRYAYRLIFSDCKKEGKGIFTINKLLPVKTILKSIYPNPGRELKLIYGIPEDMKISIDIFDVTGRKIYTLYCGRKKAGYHTITWDGKKDKMRLPAGIYFIRLKTKKDSIVKTLILLR